ncbi:MAG: hypothetical protein PHP01_07305 [Phycisphaerae bacterium]|nr:hypothetical protein [Phycisphaerae bacterium]
MPKKPDAPQEQKSAPNENDVLRKMLSTPPETQKDLPKKKVTGK